VKLTELADAAGVSPRTVRYYVQRGLLPAPVFRGKDTEYGDDHLARLKAIRALQDRFLPLDAIQAELDGAGPAGLAKLARAPRVKAAAPAAAAPAATVARWERHELAPGVELHVRDDAAARRFARRILDELGDDGGEDDER
jgi:DNA-binding transcriptional MerR regulator